MSSKEKKFSPFFRQCLVAAAVSTNMIAFGCGMGYPGILLPQLELPDSTIRVTIDQGSWIASVGSITMAFGNFLVPAVMSRAGRKGTMYVVTLISMLGWLASILAKSYEVLLIGSIIQGFTFGMFISLRSIYIGECSSPRYRGGLLTVTVEAQVFGILFVHLTGSLISYQLTALCSISFHITSLLLTMYSPESPSWLATKRQYDRCRCNFMWLRGEDETEELEKMIQTVNLSTPINRYTVKDIVTMARKKEFFKPIFLMFTLYIMLAFAGGPIMSVYSVTILELLLGPEVNANVWMVALDCLRLFVSLVAVVVINRVKRRTLLFIVGFFCAGSQLCMGVYIFAKSNGNLPFDSLWIPGLMIIVQMLSLSMGMQPLPAVIAGEVYPLQHRGLSGSVGLTMLSVAVFTVLKSFPGLLTVIGLGGTFLLFSGVIAACLAVAWVILPETSGQTLQQVEEQFRGPTDPETDESEPLTHSVAASYLSIQE